MDRVCLNAFDSAIVLRQCPCACCVYICIAVVLRAVFQQTIMQNMSSKASRTETKRAVGDHASVLAWLRPGRFLGRVVSELLLKVKLTNGSLVAESHCVITG